MEEWFHGFLTLAIEGVNGHITLLPLYFWSKNARTGLDIVVKRVIAALAKNAFLFVL
jgi:hypothetical protein